MAKSRWASCRSGSPSAGRCLARRIFFLYYFFIADKSSTVFSALNSISAAEALGCQAQPAPTRRLAQFLEPEIP